MSRAGSKGTAAEVREDGSQSRLAFVAKIGMVHVITTNLRLNKTRALSRGQNDAFNSEDKT